MHGPHCKIQCYYQRTLKVLIIVCFVKLEYDDEHQPEITNEPRLAANTLNKLLKHEEELPQLAAKLNYQ